MKTIVETAKDAGNFNIFVKAIQTVGLVDTLSEEGPFTLFTPTDKAFHKLPQGTIESILQDKEKLTEILTYHVIQNKIMSDNVVQLKKVKTANGKDLTINDFQGVIVNNAKVIHTDIECSNGVIHGIDTVLMPQQHFFKECDLIGTRRKKGTRFLFKKSR